MANSIATIELKQDITFIEIVQCLSSDTKYKYLILDVANSLEQYLNAGKDPIDGLDFLLSFYQAVPAVQDVIRNVIMEALIEYKNHIQDRGL